MSRGDTKTAKERREGRRERAIQRNMVEKKKKRTHSGGERKEGEVGREEMV